MYKLLLIFTSLYSMTLARSANIYDLNNASQYFEDFIRQYNKQYANEAEKHARFQIFKANLDEVNHLNERNFDNSTGPHAVFGITEFTDLTSEEFISTYTGLGPEEDLEEVLHQSQCRQLTDNDIPNAQAPEAFDWRQQNMVTPVKHQGTCSSCFTFSTTGHLEGQIARKYSKLLNLSQQQILDCDRRSYGCRGGFMTNSLMSIMELGGIMQASDYPYTGRQGQCRFNQRGVVAKVTSCFSYRLRSQEKLKQLLYKIGPVSIAVKYGGFQNYKSGVMPDAQCNAGQVNHAVLLVGYGTDPQQGPYWLVKNSYGTQFGESGYFRMQRGQTATSCGLMNDYMVTATVA